MRRFFTEHTTLRGFLIIGLIALVVVVLSLESVLQTVGGLLRIAFFLAIAFFLFLLWREKRGDIEAWRDRSRPRICAIRRARPRAPDRPRFG